MLLAHRLASARACLAGRSPLIVRTCVTYVPSKKPFVYYVEKDGQQVPLDLESPDAPQWHDNNDDFWRKADLFVQDQPEVHPPYHHMKWALGLLGFGSLFYFVFLQDGSAGRAWCDGWTNQDKYLMFGMDPGEYLTKEDREVIAKRREIARKLVRIVARQCSVLNYLCLKFEKPG
ncbi:uncharacterized protein LOC135818343 [Sycon ciliatum]|uniref:uncharacterized protein LOC135818343 n=1 Tax=Sycon ciliatum TaxID=27933 RepID=UPI0031F68A8E